MRRQKEKFVQRAGGGGGGGESVPCRGDTGAKVLTMCKASVAQVT